MASGLRGDELLTIAEVGELVGLSRQRIQQLAGGDDESFPLPVKTLSLGGGTRIWLRSDIQRWLRVRENRLASA